MSGAAVSRFHFVSYGTAFFPTVGTEGVALPDGTMVVGVSNRTEGAMAFKVNISVCDDTTRVVRRICINNR